MALAVFSVYSFWQASKAVGKRIEIVFMEIRQGMVDPVREWCQPAFI
jgi:hypothetical protein